MTATPYDETAYPTAIFTQTHPDRMAAIARASGLNPPPIGNARVLEIGGGDGMNLIAFGVAHPDSRCVSFDLAGSAIARGRDWRDAVGAANVELMQLDILDAADRLDGEFDYIIAHGVYAWVPEPVRIATMALIGRKLSANGVAFVSYNAQPGGHLRQALRESLLFALAGVDGQDARHKAARAHLERLAAPGEGPENPFQMAMRDAAAKTLTKRWAVLAHDELGPCFHPQALHQVVAAARGNGLDFLGDADRERMTDAFLPDDIDGADDAGAMLVRHLQDRDYRDIRFFRQTLLVRTGQHQARRLDHRTFADLLASTRCVALGDDQFRIDANTFEVRDPVLAAALVRMAAARPLRLPVAELVDSDDRRHALFEMFDAGLIDLHTAQTPAARTIDDHPRASPLVRMMIDRGMGTVCTLDHRMLGVTEDGPRSLLQMLDGSRTIATLGKAAAAMGLDSADKLDRALDLCLREGLLMP